MQIFYFSSYRSLFLNLYFSFHVSCISRFVLLSCLISRYLFPIPRALLLVFNFSYIVSRFFLVSFVLFHLSHNSIILEFWILISYFPYVPFFLFLMSDFFRQLGSVDPAGQGVDITSIDFIVCTAHGESLTSINIISQPLCTISYNHFS